MPTCRRADRYSTLPPPRSGCIHHPTAARGKRAVDVFSPRRGVALVLSEAVCTYLRNERTGAMMRSSTVYDTSTHRKVRRRMIARERHAVSSIRAYIRAYQIYIHAYVYSCSDCSRAHHLFYTTVEARCCVTRYETKVLRYAMICTYPMVDRVSSILPALAVGSMRGLALLNMRARLP